MQLASPSPVMLALSINQLLVGLGRWRRATFGLIRQWQNERRYSGAPGVVTARIHSQYLGLGAHLFMATVVLHRAEREGRRVRFEFTSPQYGAGNWLPHLYCQPTDQSGLASSPPVMIGAWSDFSRGFRRQPKRNRDELATLLRRQFSPAPPIAEAVESFATRYFGPPVLGVHYRGTDNGPKPVAWTKRKWRRRSVPRSRAGLS
ncbi:hypothetical protein [Opitutus terrae]|uniref:Uncharacterized protein n=1 Tax=Opitutus terrae (strain DSM 11246 / JCM 15787 / PB90-1) TaxID=452637 RepID=B1ZRY0_OPITP|nr:hypothetical protein [Opitutus terrae]ACB74734.1 hypothetical protein Oter_1450 [Opitutus terrae PB90-1]